MISSSIHTIFNKKIEFIEVESVILPIIADLIKYNGSKIKFKTFWNELKKNIPGKDDEKKPNEYHAEDYGTIYRNTITGLLSDTFGLKTKHDRDGNVLILDRQVIENLSKTDKTKIIVKELSKDNERSNYDDDDVDDDQDIECEDVKAVSPPDRGISQIMDEKKNIKTQNPTDSSILVNDSPQKEKGNSIPLSNAFTAFTHSHSETRELEFNNPLIFKSDLATGNYNPKIINNINRLYPNSDRWFCTNYTFIDDKWGMMKHLCKHTKKKKDKKEKES